MTISSGWLSAHCAVQYDLASVARLAKNRNLPDWESALLRALHPVTPHLSLERSANVRLYKPQAMPTSSEIAEFLETEFPQTKCTVDSVGPLCATVRHPVSDAELRPGGTVSGPVLMAVADVALYVAIMGEIGIVPLVVSTSLTINFMRKPAATADIVATCKLMKVGKSLAVGEVSLYSDGATEPVAHAVGTYSIPPRNTWPRTE